MKKLFQATLSILLSILFSGTVYATNPVDGVYIGVIGELSTGPRSRVVTFDYPARDSVHVPDNPAPPFIGRVDNNRLGGGGGGMLGYKIGNFRLEGELLYNWVNAVSIGIDNCYLQSPRIQTPVGACGSFHNLERFYLNEVGFQGSTSTFYGLFNVYYDFFFPDNPSQRDFYPFVGVGIGSIHVRSGVSFVNTVIPPPIPISEGFNTSANGLAAQGIIGFGYYLDDLTWATLDYRYLSSTAPLRNISNSRFGISTFNLTLNFSLDTLLC